MQQGIFALIIAAALLAGCAPYGGNNLTQPPRESARPEPSEPPEVPEPSEQAEKKTENRVLSAFSTTLLDKKKSRVKNITLAANAVNKAAVMPGETFSFNKTVGPRTAAKGYEKALVIMKKEKVLGYGGGICQVSTALYNAAKRAGLEIVERHEHNGEVGYVKLGDDATVTYDALDLKIKNTKEIPVKFRVTVGENSVDAAVIEAR
ncbi:MAG: VanW family protein [Clostridiales bacterium]|jgi:vancomycin resistance protein YoaR|nr:VanW family protein [Clostridiales bacterium]